MRDIASLFLYLMIAAYAQNFLMGGAVDTTSMLSVVRRPSRLFICGGFTSLFALLTCAVTMPFDRYFPLWAISTSMPVRAAVTCAAVILWYLLILRIVSLIPKLNAVTEGLIAPGAFSGAAVAVPLMLFRGENSPVSFWNGSITHAPEVIGYCIGAGLGFALASWLLNAGMRRADNPDIPAALRGTPVMLIYIGIIALALSC
ncbi:MAG: hypothetical protein E7554_00620 [Ruminococcaceae bacterium]|nr:hypothetical protein [Oscillospiraceae bacterium]